MRLRIAALSGVLLATFLSLPAAFAKGPSQGVIQGPGLAPLPLRDPGAGTIGPELAAMVQYSGFLGQLFGTDEARKRRPDGPLGVRYTVTYTMDGPPGTDATVKQFVFPFAAVGPVTHAPLGQPYWGSRATGGGWYIGGRKLSVLLDSFGIRPAAPAPTNVAAPSTGSETSLAPVVYLVVVLALLALLAVFVLRRSTPRRMQSA